MTPHQFILTALKLGGKASKNGEKPEQNINGTADLASVTVLFDLMREQVADQQKQIDTLDTKASVILGAATVLAGAAVTLFPGLISSHAAILIDSRIWWLLPTLIAVYIVLICFACLAYTVRRYKRVPDPQALYDNYRDKSEYFIKARVFTAMVTASTENEARIRKKVLWVTCSIIAGYPEYFLGNLLYHRRLPRVLSG
jgi:hypothetical protein